jgi:hypothetical protein
MSTEDRGDPSADASRPVLRVVHGDPTPEELAALSAVVAAVSTPAPEPRAATARGRWADPFDQHARPWQPGPGGWRAAVR